MTFSILVAARAAADGAAAGAWKAATPTERAPSVAMVPSVRARVMAPILAGASAEMAGCNARWWRQRGVCAPPEPRRHGPFVRM